MSISINNLTFCYGNRTILDNVNFDIARGTLVSILGPNGVGKSTLFRCILGLQNQRKCEGSIYINGIDSKNLSIKKLASMIAYIPQSHHIAFNYKVIDTVLMSTNVLVNGFSSPGKEQLEIAYEALERVGAQKLADRGYAQISGGERQLVLIARALAQKAKILIMDEPTANLDYGNQIRILSQVKKLANEGYTILQSTHNPDQALLYADEALVLSNGQVLKFGNPKEIITTDLLKDIYGVNIELNSLYSDQIRVCIPIDEIKSRKVFI